MAKKTVSFEERETNILSRYFTVNKEKKSRTINLYFDSAENLLEDSHQKKENRFFSSEVRDEVQNDIAKRPNSYKADIILRVKDYGDRKPEELNTKLNDSFSIRGFSHQNSRKSTWFAATRLALFGLATLYLRYFLQTEGYLVEDTTNVEIIKELMDTTATVFIWEAVSIVLVTPSEDTFSNISSIRKINSISFADYEGKVRLVYSTGKAKGKYRPWSSFRKSARVGLLVAGGGLWGMGFTRLLSRIDTLLHIDKITSAPGLTGRAENIAIIIYLTFSIIFILSCFFAGVGAFNLYNNSTRFRTLAILGDVIIAGIFGLGLFIGITNQEPKIIIQCGFTFAFLLISIISSLLQMQKRTNIRDTSLVVKLETAQERRQREINERVSQIEKQQKLQNKIEKKQEKKKQE